MMLSQNILNNTYRVKINVGWILISILIIPIPTFGVIGKLIFWGMMAYSYEQYFINRDWFWSINLKFITPVTLLIIWMGLRSQNLYGIKNFILFSILMFFFISNMPYKKLSTNTLKVLWYTVLGMSFFVGLTGNFYTNTNIGAVITAIIVLLVYIHFPKKRKMSILLGGLAIFLYDSRAVILALVIAIVIIYLVKKKIISIGKLLLFIIIILGIGIYISWDYIMSPEFNAYIYAKTGKNFQSGRNFIWGAIFSYMKGIDWLIGVGGGVDHSTIVPSTYKNMSLHSTYVYMIFHYGFIGLSLLGYLFYRIINSLLSKKYYYSGILFLFFVFRDFFEITLVNNQMAIGILFWGWIANGWIERPSKVSFSRNFPDRSLRDVADGFD